LDGHLIHQTLFVGFKRMEDEVVDGQWLGPVDGFLILALWVHTILTFVWDQQPAQ
jgi:hypothetical protein